jgi:hypothetical protein
MRVDITRASGTPAREIQVVSGTSAWNEIDKIGGGSIRDGAAPSRHGRHGGSVSASLDDSFGVVKAAVAAGDKTMATVETAPRL